MVVDRVIGRRRLRQRGQIGGFLGGQLGQFLVEIGLRRGRHAIAVLTEIDLVHVEFEDLVLAQRLLDPGGQDQFLDLALRRSVRGQQEVLHHLLGDGRGAAERTALRHGHRRRDHAHRVIALVDVEVLVLGRDEGFLHQVGDLGRRHEQTAFPGEFVDQLAFRRIDPADRRGCVLGELFVVRQVAAIHPEHGADDQRDQEGADGQEAEDCAKNAEDEAEHANAFRGCLSRAYTLHGQEGQNHNMAPGRTWRSSAACASSARCGQCHCRARQAARRASPSRMSSGVAA